LVWDFTDIFWLSFQIQSTALLTSSLHFFKVNLNLCWKWWYS
jgi:hypothetical protein